jgi:release factor glutamine methyltransferase
VSVSSSAVELGFVVERLRASGCVFAEDEAALIVETARDAAELAAMVDRRVAGSPLEYVVGWASFRGLRIAVDPGVFIPRRRTEFLVAEALRVTVAGSIVVDLGCGSGALGAAVAAEREVSLYAADIEPAAVQCARRNVEPFGGTVYQGDLFAALPESLRGKVDVLLANVPYVPTDEIRLLPPEARLYEPHVTLDGGPDGLATLRRVVVGAAEWLGPGGQLFVEMSDHQAPVARALMIEHRLDAEITTDEDLGANVVHGIKPGAAHATGTPGG